MSAEFWAIVAASVGLTGLILSGNRKLTVRIDRLAGEIVAPGQRMAHLEGLLEGLREAIAHNRAA